MRYDKKLLGIRIREERKKHNLTIEQLAEIIDLSTSFLTTVELGKRGLSVEKLIDIANYFDIIVDDLLHINKDRSSYRLEKLDSLIHNISNEDFEFITDIIIALKKRIDKIQ